MILRSFAALLLAVTLGAPTPALADLPDGATIEKKIKAKKLEALFVGRWTVELPPDATRALDLMRLALKGGTEAELEALKPTDEERQTYALLQMASMANGAEETANMLAELEAAVSGITFEVGPGTIGLTMGDETTSATWKTVRTENNLLVVSTTMDGGPPSDIQVWFVNKDRLFLYNDQEESFYVVRQQGD